MSNNLACILWIEQLGTNYREYKIKIQYLLYPKMNLWTSSAKWQQFPLGLNVLYWNDIDMDCNQLMPNGCNFEILMEFMHAGHIIGQETISILSSRNSPLDTMRSEQNGRHFANDISDTFASQKHIFSFKLDIVMWHTNFVDMVQLTFWWQENKFTIKFK